MIYGLYSSKELLFLSIKLNGSSLPLLPNCYILAVEYSLSIMRMIIDFSLGLRMRKNHQPSLQQADHILYRFLIANCVVVELEPELQNFGAR